MVKILQAFPNVKKEDLESFYQEEQIDYILKL